MDPEEVHTTVAPESIAAAAIDWKSVYAEQLPRVYNYFRFRIGRQADIEDLTARPFEKAWKARDRYRRDLAAARPCRFESGSGISSAHRPPAQ